MLDSARLRVLPAETCRVSPANVHAHVIGEHGDSELAVWSAAFLGGVPIGQCCAPCDLSRNCDLVKHELFDRTRRAFRPAHGSGSKPPRNSCEVT